MKIISTTNGRFLAKEIANLLKIECCTASVNQFNNQELNYEVLDEVAENDVLLVAQIGKNLHEDLFEVFLLSSLIKRKTAKKLTLFIPFLPYSRKLESAENLARLIESSGIDKIITLDVHEEKIKEFYSIDFVNIFPNEFFINILKDKDNLVIVSPDHGSITRAKQLAKSLNVEYAYFEKLRSNDGKVTLKNFHGDVEDKSCFIIDDMIDTGNSILKTLKALEDLKAKSVSAGVSHLIISNDSVKRISESTLENIYSTNSIYHETLPEKFLVKSIANLTLKSVLGF